MGRTADRLVGAGAAVIGLALLALVGLWAARQGDGPTGMLPGGPFRAEAEPCPVRWDRLGSFAELELEVHPARPRTLTAWNVQVEGTLYVPADFLTPWKRWPHQVVADPRVRLRVSGRVYACQLSRVEDEGLVARLRATAATKYGLRSDGLAARVRVWWFRVEPVLLDAPGRGTIPPHPGGGSR